MKPLGRRWRVWIGLLVAVGLLAVFVGAGLRPGPSSDPAAGRWTQITDSWTPAREAARTALSGDAEFTAQLADYKAFYDATRGWVEEVRAYDWSKGDPGGDVSSNVRTFLADGDRYVTLLQQASTAAAPGDLAAMAEDLATADQTWDVDVAVVRLALGLPVVPVES